LRFKSIKNNMTTTSTVLPLRPCKRSRALNWPFQGCFLKFANYFSLSLSLSLSTSLFLSLSFFLSCLLSLSFSLSLSLSSFFLVDYVLRFSISREICLNQRFLDRYNLRYVLFRALYFFYDFSLYFFKSTGTRTSIDNVILTGL
jgi:hypothetical protein